MQHYYMYMESTIVGDLEPKAQQDFFVEMRKSVTDNKTSKRNELQGSLINVCDSGHLQGLPFSLSVERSSGHLGEGLRWSSCTAMAEQAELKLHKVYDFTLIVVLPGHIRLRSTIEVREQGSFSTSTVCALSFVADKGPPPQSPWV